MHHLVRLILYVVEVRDRVTSEGILYRVVDLLELVYLLRIEVLLHLHHLIWNLLRIESLLLDSTTEPRYRWL